MADKKENEMKEFQYVDFIRGIFNKDSGIISISNLLKNTLNTKGEVSQNIDNYINTGIYGINKDRFNSGPIQYGMLIVFNGEGTAFSGDPIVQIAFNHEGLIKYRLRWFTLGWNSWKTISFTE